MTFFINQKRIKNRRSFRLFQANPPSPHCPPSPQSPQSPPAHPEFEIGTKVKTTVQYFQAFGAKHTGTVYKINKDIITFHSDTGGKEAIQDNWLEKNS